MSTRTERKSNVNKRTKEEELFWTWAFYSDSGVGKTTLSATAPRPRFLDSNQGMLSVHGRPGFEHVKRTPIRNWRDLESAYRNFKGTGEKDWTKTRTIIFDHFDDIQGLVLDELTEQAAEKDTRRQVDETQQREWGIMLNRLRRIMRKFKALPMHKILIFAQDLNRETGKLEPSLQGKFKTQLPYFCDMIGQIRVTKGGKRLLDFRLSEERVTKCRAWWIPETERKFFIPDVANDSQFLTTLFETIAAGPQSVKSKRQ